MCLLIWQALVATCLSNLLFCGSASKETGVTEDTIGSDEDDLNGCPAKNSKHPVYIPHPTDCSKFYICDSGSPYLQTCQTGLHFNIKIKACDFPDKAGCNKDLGATEEPDDLDDEDDSDGCPAKNSKHPIYIPHPTDCSKFYICDSGSPHLQTCQAGLHFNKKIKACDFPDHAGCDKEITEDPGELVDEDDSEGCPAKNSKHPVYIPHPFDCNKFYICDSGSPHLQTCQAGLHFNMKIKACDFPNQAGCDKDIPNVMAGAGVHSSFCPPVNGKTDIFFRNPSNCSIFYMCSYGLAYEFVCPARLHFNLRKKQCDYEDEARCPSH